jgi:hypothetical protein
MPKRRSLAWPLRSAWCSRLPKTQKHLRRSAQQQFHPRQNKSRPLKHILYIFLKCPRVRHSLHRSTYSRALDAAHRGAVVSQLQSQDPDHRYRSAISSLSCSSKAIARPRSSCSARAAARTAGSSLGGGIGGRIGGRSVTSSALSFPSSPCDHSQFFCSSPTSHGASPVGSTKFRGY